MACSAFLSAPAVRLLRRKRVEFGRVSCCAPSPYRNSRPAGFSSTKRSRTSSPDADNDEPLSNSVAFKFAGRIMYPALAAVVAMLPVHEVAAMSAVTAVAGPLFAPLNPDTPDVLRTVVWGDFRVAVALFVAAPLTIFVWSLFDTDSDSDAVLRVMVGYWQSSSLLLLTVFLNIANVSAASFTGLFVQGLIPFTLLWWTDLLAEIEKDDSSLSRAFRAWRWPAIAAAVGGVAIQLPFQGCSFTEDPQANPICSSWLEPPTRFHEILIPGVEPQTLQILAFAGCTIYASYLLWLCFVVLPRVGRSGRKDRNCFSSVSALKFFGIIKRDSLGN